MSTMYTNYFNLFQEGVFRGKKKNTNNHLESTAVIAYLLLIMEIEKLDMRLTNLEESVRHIKEMVGILPRLEERMVSQKNDLQDHELRLRNLEKVQNKNNVYVSWSERFVLVGITLFASGAWRFFVGG